MLLDMSNFPSSTDYSGLMVPVRHHRLDRHDSLPNTSRMGKHHKAFLASNNFGKNIIRLKNALGLLFADP